jgi:nitrogen fixation protein NifU and related proteins
MYPPQLLEHFRNPRNVGELAAPAVVVEVSNPACGDILRLSAELRDGVVAAVGYKIRGCTASVAAGSALTTWMLGKPLAECRTLQASQIDAELGGLPAESKHAAVLAVDVLRAWIAAVSK